MTGTDTHKYSSDDALIGALHKIHRSPRGWNSLTATELFAYAARRLSGIARSEGVAADSADADIIAAAWEVWLRPSIFGAEKPWGWTAAAVRHELANESIAARTLTSVAARHRVDFDPTIQFANDALDSVETAQSLLFHGQGPVAASSTSPVFETLALRAAVSILTGAGHSRLIAEAAVDAVVELGTTCTTLASAADKAKRDTTMPDALGLDRATWRTLVLLILGGATGTDASAGLIAAERAGTAFEEVKNIRNARRRLMG